MERFCRRHGLSPCTCEMGNLYRFTEPIVLLSLARLGSAHGYQIAQEAERLSITHAGLDSAAVYRTLRRLENMGRLESKWETGEGGPARRVYMLTPSGREHLREWVKVMGDVADSLVMLKEKCMEVLD